MKKVYAIVRSTETGSFSIHITDKYLGFVEDERTAAIIVNKLNKTKKARDTYHFITIDEFENANDYKYTNEEIESDFNNILKYINCFNYDGLKDFPLGEMAIEIYTCPEENSDIEGNWYISLWKVDVYSEETIDEDFEKVSGYNFIIDNEDDKRKAKDKIIEDLKKIKDDLIAKE